MNGIKKIASIWWMQWAWPAKLISLTAVFLIIAGGYIACREMRHSPKLNQKETQRAKQAVADQDRKEMIQVLAESDAREKAADATAINASTVTINAIGESKKKWSAASNDEMTAELERRAKESQ